MWWNYHIQEGRSNSCPLLPSQSSCQWQSILPTKHISNCCRRTWSQRWRRLSYHTQYKSCQRSSKMEVGIPTFLFITSVVAYILTSLKRCRFFPIFQCGYVWLRFCASGACRPHRPHWNIQCDCSPPSNSYYEQQFQHLDKVHGQRLGTAQRKSICRGDHFRSATVRDYSLGFQTGVQEQVRAETNHTQDDMCRKRKSRCLPWGQWR